MKRGDAVAEPTPNRAARAVHVVRAVRAVRVVRAVRALKLASGTTKRLAS